MILSIHKVSNKERENTMEDTKVFIKKELAQKDFTHKEAIRAIRCWFAVHTEYGGYVEHDFTFHKWADGSISISENDGDDFISIHDKDILDVLRELLK